MDTTLAGLIQGCAEAPQDNAPRLILADWLEDHGQPERAELVRLQCRLADWVPDWQERRALIARQDELIAAHRDTWLGPLTKLCHRVAFVRGLCRVWVSSQNFCTSAFGTALTDRHGTALVEQVRLTRCKALSRVVSRPWLALVPALSLARLELNDAGLGPLLTSEYVEHLVDLDVSGTPVRWDQFKALIDSQLYGRLTRLALRNTGASDATVAALLEAAPERLRDLDVGGADLKPATFQALAARQQAGRIMNSLGMEFVRIPAGSFLMGAPDSEAGHRRDEVPAHPVTLTKSYWLGRFAVTQGQYLAVMGDNPARFSSDGLALPVENVDYSQVTKFCQRLAKRKEERAAKYSYRLPTEAEWEHACRAGTFTPFSIGNTASLDFMNYQGRFTSDEPERAHPARPLPVGTYPPNAFGLYEMHGNVWEWTTDWMVDDWYAQSPEVDPTGPRSGEVRALRGGGWHAVGLCLRSAHRYGEELETQDDFTGFRVILVGPE
jgi:uncharacterized protein (TIGR02996 family)